MIRIARLLPASLKKSLKALREMLQHSPTPLPLESLPNVPDLFHVYRYLNEHSDLERKPGGWVYKGKFYPDYLTVGGASHAIFREALRFCQGLGIDVGAGLWPLPDVIPADIRRGPGVGRTVSDFESGSLDYVFSSHCLEHIENWQETLAEWVSKLRLGGVLFLYLPHPDCGIWHPGSPIVGDGHKWVPRPEIIKSAMQELSCQVVAYDDGPDAMYSFWVCGQKIGS